MIKKFIGILGLLVVFSGMTSFTVAANELVGVNSLSHASASLLRSDSLDALIRPFPLSVKKGEPYDPSKDPALRKGTENWEEPQGSFFAVPAVVLGIVAVLLFFSKKDE